MHSSVTLCSLMRVTLIAVICGIVVPQVHGHHNFTISVHTRINFIADPRYVSFTLDMWESNDTKEGAKWGDFGALQFNFSDWRLQSLAAALAPAVLRVGGSPEDSITYLVNGTECTNATQPNPNYRCSQVGEYQYGCLTMNRWAAMSAFASGANLDLVFGLNACYGRPCKSCPMDLSNIQNFLMYTKQNNIPFYGFEFGNELTHLVEAQAYAMDVKSLKVIMDEVWPDPTSQPAFIMPDVPVTAKYEGTSYLSDILANFTQQKAPANAMSMHEYPNCLPQRGSTAVLEPACLDLIQQTAAAFANATRGHVDQLWVGESADHSGGGRLGVTNTFISSFYYADQLGALASVNNINLVARQCFIGGDYELVNRTTLKPNPDYWIALLFKKLLSPSALNATVSGASDSYNISHARVYSYCSTMGGVGVLVINLDLNNAFEAKIELHDVGGPIGERYEYHLTAQEVSDDVVMCNGVPLEIDEYYQPIMPEVPPLVSHRDLIIAKPASIVFVQYPNTYGEC